MAYFLHKRSVEGRTLSYTPKQLPTSTSNPAAVEDKSRYPPTATYNSGVEPMERNPVYRMKGEEEVSFKPTRPPPRPSTPPRPTDSPSKPSPPCRPVPPPKRPAGFSVNDNNY